jgi:hypothetical protein
MPSLSQKKPGGHCVFVPKLQVEKRTALEIKVQ